MIVEPYKALIVVENNTVPMDRRVWYEATTLRDAGWEVSIICPVEGNNHTELNRGTSPEMLDGIAIFRFPLAFADRGIKNYIREYFTAFREITKRSNKLWKQRGFNIIHICNPPDIFFLLGIYYRILGAKFVYDHHDLFPEMVLWRYSGISGKIFHSFARLFELLTLRCANIVIATNESYRNLDIKRGRLPQNKVVIVRNGPNSVEFTPTAPVAEIKQGYRFMVCFVGIMGEEDGVVELADSIRYIIQELGRTDIRFVLVGDGAVRDDIQSSIDMWGIQNYVDMPGMVKDNNLLRQYISTADICVSPEPMTPLNRYSTFIKVGEYMVLGKPVVAYDLEETRKTAQSAAVYVHPGDIKGFGDAIIELLSDPERRYKMGEIGRKRVSEELSWEHQRKNLIKAYELALNISNNPETT